MTALPSLFDFAPEEGGASFELAGHLCRPDGRLYGGTGLAAVFALIAEATGRHPLWATVQFVGTAEVGERIACRTEVVAHGGSVDQVDIRLHAGGRLVCSALGSAGRVRPDGMAGTSIRMPAVAGPDEGQAPGQGRWGSSAMGQHLASRIREVPIDPADQALGRVAMWARLENRRAASDAEALAFLADMVPIAIARGCGAMGAGTSLDNALRILDTAGSGAADGEWVLLELQGHGAHAGFGHGAVHAWSRDGRLLATGTQTAKLFDFESRGLPGSS